MAEHAQRIDGNRLQSDRHPLSEAVRTTERTMPGHAFGRNNMREWQLLCAENLYLKNTDFQHTVRYHLGAQFARADKELAAFGARIPVELEAAVAENDLRFNNPRIDNYSGIGDRIEKVVHHPDYAVAGDIIYGTDLVRKLTEMGGLREGYAFYFLSNNAGETGHNCPVICGYEAARVLRDVEDFDGRQDYIDGLLTPSYTENLTASQFLSEVQGGSDVGANETMAWQDDNGDWLIRGEKWFCSNANADLMVISARHDPDIVGTKGLSVFLIPAVKPDGSRNHYTMRRLKEKMGTRALASAEIDYHDAYAIPLGDTETGFKVLMERVIHHSRIALAVAVLGFTARAYQLALDFARTRHAFGNVVVNYPLVRQNLANIKSDMTASLAGTYALIALQDDIDTGVVQSEEDRAFCRLMTNIGKSVISKRAVDNVHHCIDGIGGNGAIETTSAMPRLFRDVVILENWEGTHNTLYMQILRDIARYDHDKIYLSVMRRRIDAIPAARLAERSTANAAYSQIEAMIVDLHVASDDLKTLNIADVVTWMANLFYYVECVREGDHQLNEDGTDSKLRAAELFERNFLTEKADAYDADYLVLCSAVIGY